MTNYQNYQDDAEHENALRNCRLLLATENKVYCLYLQEYLAFSYKKCRNETLRLLARKTAADALKKFGLPIPPPGGWK